MGHRGSRRSASKALAVLVTLTVICHTLAFEPSWHAHAFVLDHTSSLRTRLSKTLTYTYAEGDEQMMREEKKETKGRKRPW